MTAETEDGRPAGALHHKIVRAAADVLESEGLDALSTRAVAARAGVFPPTIFRLFGDKDGLLEALGEHGFDTYLEAKSRLPRSDDPVADLRLAWDLHVRFGLEQPAYYALVFGPSRSGRPSQAGRRALVELQRMLTRVAAAGRLRMSVERATALMHAAGVGVVTTMISTPPDTRDPELARVARDVVFDAMIAPPGAEPGGGAPGAGPAGPAMALRAALAAEGELPLSPGEELLLLELLNRLADVRRSGEG
ncbi:MULTISPECIES: TetR/AcrR family transcriptional regulator [unclassified Streptomyces]|uniref:TetR/AcrR family transcriptional regulator n=1 Tax=unclassified Streptomyces TaxID=2593676 RepID=UPI0011CE2570|nr:MULTISPECIES: TetR/AcrR family transcriptional regulator [unclassified Streptomyces]TXS79311.1 TetR/AcrR family transcriptional regulator [Streptomyces sp. me109]